MGENISQAELQWLKNAGAEAVGAIIPVLIYLPDWTSSHMEMLAVPIVLSSILSQSSNRRGGMVEAFATGLSLTYSINVLSHWAELASHINLVQKGILAVAAIETLKTSLTIGRVARDYRPRNRPSAPAPTIEQIIANEEKQEQRRNRRNQRDNARAKELLDRLFDNQSMSGVEGARHPKPKSVNVEDEFPELRTNFFVFTRSWKKRPRLGDSPLSRWAQKVQDFIDASGGSFYADSGPATSFSERKDIQFLLPWHRKYWIVNVGGKFGDSWGQHRMRLPYGMNAADRGDFEQRLRTSLESCATSREVRDKIRSLQDKLYRTELD